MGHWRLAAHIGVRVRNICQLRDSTYEAQLLCNELTGAHKPTIPPRRGLGGKPIQSEHKRGRIRKQQQYLYGEN